jgi:hypothetical protein
MEGPDEDFRQDISARLSNVPVVAVTRQGQVERVVTDQDEELLVDILNYIADRATSDVRYSSVLDEGRREEVNEEEAYDLLGAIDSWASLISYAVESVYAPQSPLPRGLAGWGKKIGKALQKVVSILLTPLKLVAAGLQASGWSIGLSFPWGVSVSLNWP